MNTVFYYKSNKIAAMDTHTLHLYCTKLEITKWHPEWEYFD